jgi:hypothetical protein
MKVMKDALMEKVILLIEVIKKYYLLNIHQTLLAKILLLNVKAELMSPFLYAGSYLKGLCHK